VLVLAVIVQGAGVMGVVGSTRWLQQQKDQHSEASQLAEEPEQIAQKQERGTQDRERALQESERMAREQERQRSEAEQKHLLTLKQVHLEYAEQLLSEMMNADEAVPNAELRKRAIEEISKKIKLSKEDVVVFADEKLPRADPATPNTSLDLAREALAQERYDEVIRLADEQRQEGREFAMLEGTAALATFRELPKPKWNDRALPAFRRAFYAFRRAVTLSDRTKEPEAWAAAAIAAASLLDDAANFSEAESLLIKAQQILEEQHGPESKEVAVVLKSLSLVHFHTNRLAEAEPLMRRALAIAEQSYGALHPNVARDLNNLAAMLQETNRFAEAEPLMRRALAISEQSYGADHSDVAIKLNNLAQLLQSTNRFAEAEPLMRRALAIDEQSYGAEHSDVAIKLNNLAQLLQSTNRLAEAEPLIRRALSIDEQSYGPEHPTVATRLNNLATLLKATNRLAEAEPLMRRALSIAQQTYGAEHPEVAARLNNLAQLLQATNRLAEAEPLMRRALAIDEQSYGADHANVAIFLNNLVLLLQGTNRLTEAELLMRRVVTIFMISSRQRSHEHPGLQLSLDDYRKLLQSLELTDERIEERLNNVKAATEPLKPIVAEVERLLGPAKPVAEVLEALDRQYKAEGKPAVYFLASNQPMGPQLIELFKPNPDALIAAGDSAYLNGEHARAIVLYDEALKLLDDKFDNEKTMFSTHLNRASSLRELGALDQARDDLRLLLSRLDEGDSISALSKGQAYALLFLCDYGLGNFESAQLVAEKFLQDYGEEAELAYLKKTIEKLLVVSEFDNYEPFPSVTKIDTAAVLESARVRFRARAELATLPLDQSALPLLDQMLGPAQSVEEVLEALDRQYREQGKSDVWFLPLSEPIAPHLDELLGPVPQRKKE
jgi:hypothetical protein